MPKTKYENLTIEPSKKFKQRYEKEKRIGKIFGSYFVVRIVIVALARLIPVESFIRIRQLAGAYAGTQKYIGKRDALLNNPLSFISGFGYSSEQTELQTAKYYKNQIEERSTASATESFDLYDHVVDVLSNLLTNDYSIEVVSNFGVSYAYVDSVLAKKFINRQFVGIDRSKLTQEFNQDIFKELPNLTFQALDIFEYLTNQSKCGVLVHIRTCTLLPKDFISSLYLAAYRSNVKYIVGFEQVGWSRETDHAYQFSDDDQDTVVFRGFMNIHNYPGILKAAGFRIERIEMLKTAHPDEDYRIISFVASKIE
jgi:hypothetical protein